MYSWLRWRRLGVFVVALVLWSTQPPPNSASAASVTTAQLQQAIELRQQWGFENDPAYVLSVEASATARPTSTALH